MSILFTRKPIVINAELAERIGLNQAIVLQQLNYWITGTSSGEEFEGRKWVYNTFEAWQAENFPFWSVDTVKRTFTQLKKAGLIDVEQLRKSQHDHTNFYTINYGNPLLSDQGNLHQSNGAKCTEPSGQNASAHQGKLQQPIGAKCPDLHTEITSENTTETTPDILPAAGKPTPPAEGELLPPVLSKKEQQQQNETEFQNVCRDTWRAYQEAYAYRYKTEPVRNAKVNTQIRQLVQRLGKEAAPVAAFYVFSVNEQFVVRKSHDLGALLASAEGYRTQWATNSTMTATRARQIDGTAANASVAEEAKQILRQQREREGRQ